MSRHRSFTFPMWILALSVLFLPIPASATGEGGDPEGVTFDSAADLYHQGYRAVLDGDWPAAAHSFDRLIVDHPTSEWVDDAGFWTCYALEREASDPARAFDCYAGFVAHHGASDWADDARRALVSLAEGLARRGETGYRDRVRRLVAGTPDAAALEVLQALARPDDPERLSRLLEQIGETPDPVLRARMVDALEGVDHPEVLDALRSWVDHDPDPDVQLAALETLGDLGRITRRDLIGIAGDPARAEVLRVAALDELSDDPASPALVAMLRSVALDGSSLAPALAAVAVLGDLPEPEALEALADALATVQGPRLRLATLKAVSEHEGVAALELLRSSLESDPSGEVTPLAVPMLAEHETEAAFTALLGFLEPRFPKPVRAAALDGLAEFESARAAGEIARLLESDVDEALRTAAIAALGKNGHDAGIEPLLRAAREDGGESSRVEVLKALEEIGGRRARRAVDLLRAAPSDH